LLQVVSLFSGAGGLDLAAEMTGAIHTVARLEIQQEYCDTLRRAESDGHMSPAPLFDEDIRTVSVSDVWGAGLKSPLPRGVIGGPPCETFSTMGKGLGLKDPRGTLIMAFADFVVKSSADFFVLENVPPLEKAAKGTVFRELLGRFSDAGFLVSHQLLNAADYGAATLRRRLFVVGVRSGPSFVFPAPTHSPDGMFGIPWVGAGQALAGLPAPSDDPPGIPSGHYRIKHRPEVVRRFSTVAPGSYDYVRRRSRLSMKDPSASLVAGTLSGARAHIHPTEDRELTLRELARIHGFGDDFRFSGGHAAVSKQIANAVPIPLGRAVMQSLVSRSW
jgi:DNA (cytosine-5)-methyltransferase 1